MPDSLWKDSSALSGAKVKVAHPPPATSASASTPLMDLPGGGESALPPMPSIANPTESPEASGGAAAAGGGATAPGPGPGSAATAAAGGATAAKGAGELRQAVNQGLEQRAGGGLEPEVPDMHLLDDATREEVLGRARVVAQVSEEGGGAGSGLTSVIDAGVRPYICPRC